MVSDARRSCGDVGADQSPGHPEDFKSWEQELVAGRRWVLLRAAAAEEYVVALVPAATTNDDKKGLRLSSSAVRHRWQPWSVEWRGAATARVAGVTQRDGRGSAGMIWPCSHVCGGGDCGGGHGVVAGGWERWPRWPPGRGERGSRAPR